MSTTIDSGTPWGGAECRSITSYKRLSIERANDGHHPASIPAAKHTATTKTYSQVCVLLANQLLDLPDLARQGAAQVLRAVLGDQQRILDADADVFFRD